MIYLMLKQLEDLPKFNDVVTAALSFYEISNFRCVMFVQAHI